MSSFTSEFMESSGQLLQCILLSKFVLVLLYKAADVNEIHVKFS
uniref:Uncharacterized protein n=1 Tax=Rhizophora mucronata TaxID=61149 RepID=A0A2P2PYE7_RHIMU